MKKKKKDKAVKGKAGVMKLLGAEGYQVQNQKKPKKRKEK